MDDGFGAWYSRGIGRRPADRIDCPCSYGGLTTRLFSFSCTGQTDRRGVVAAMLPVGLKPDQFRVYPAKARKLVLDHLDALKRLPVTFLPSLLRDLIVFGWRFPPHCNQLDTDIP